VKRCNSNKRDIILVAVTVEKSKPVGTAGAVVDVVDGPVLPVQAGPADDEQAAAAEVIAAALCLRHSEKDADTVSGTPPATVTWATILQALLSFYAPSLAALQLAIEICSAQRRVASEREGLGKIVRDELRNATPGAIPPGERDRVRAVARDVQDGVYRTRPDVARVPHWLCRLKRHGRTRLRRHRRRTPEAAGQLTQTRGGFSGCPPLSGLRLSTLIRPDSKIV
jgi:hypothetical protein